jgi:hypothetical protein
MNLKQVELMAMQSLLPGLTVAAEQAIELLNEARTVLGLPPVGINAGAGNTRKSRGGPPATDNKYSIHEAPPVVGTGKRRVSKLARQKLGASTRERWAAVKEAGIDTKGKLPTAADLARARKMIARRKV